MAGDKYGTPGNADRFKPDASFNNLDADVLMALSTLATDGYLDYAALDSSPGHKTGRVALASANWDPDADGAAEFVISDGGAWNEIVDFGGTL